MGRILLAFAAVGALLATAGDYYTAKRKMDLIQQERVAAGSRVVFPKDELNAWVRQAVPQVAPEGIRDPRLELGSGTATGFAYVDFPKLRQAQGKPMNWFLARMLAGERPVKVLARVRSSGGQATVDVQSVEISGMEISGGALDFLIHNFLWSYYPEAQIGKPFQLAHRIDRLELQPAQVNVVIGR